MKVHLISIDPQNDFCIAVGPGGEKGALVVGGADADMTRLGAFITKNQKRLSEISVTLDSHQYIHIAHDPADPLLRDGPAGIGVRAHLR